VPACLTPPRAGRTFEIPPHRGRNTLVGASPFELDSILHAPDPAHRDAAWSDLVARHSRLLLAVARSFGGDRDEAMDRYAYILEKLCEGDYHRLRVFQAEGRATFSTWLTVAARRLCLDHHRSRYGRSRPTQDADKTAALRTVRRRLADSLGAELDVDLLPDAREAAADNEMIRRERNTRLAAELENLAPQDRVLLALRFEDDLSASKIAGLIGMPTPFHVHRRLRTVLARLRTGLGSHGIDDSSG